VNAEQYSINRYQQISTDIHNLLFQALQIGFAKVVTVATSISRISTFLILRSFIGHNLKFWEHRHQDSQFRTYLKPTCSIIFSQNATHCTFAQKCTNGCKGLSHSILQQCAGLRGHTANLIGRELGSSSR
jgi:hypothetical protein